MKNYIHKGLIKNNGVVDTSESISDASVLKVFPKDDGYKLTTPEIGNFEWWYFDIIDEKKECILKLVVHLGTDPLRRRFFPQLAVTIKTPTSKQTFMEKYSLTDFTACADYCDVKLKNDFHVFTESSHSINVYHVQVNIAGFKAKLTFIGEVEGWKPLGDKVKMEIGKKKGTLFWIIPMPKAKVVGEFSVGNEKYELKEALGYHDHNCWEVGLKRKLFMDEVISKWYWGRLLTKDYSIVFMNTCLRRYSIKSFMIARDNKIIHSSNNLINILEDKFIKDEDIKTLYPSKITVSSSEEDNPFKMTLTSKEIIEKRDLLEGTYPFIGRLIKIFVSRPSYYGILADSTLSIADEEIKGIAMYELMIFRNR